MSASKVRHINGMIFSRYIFEAVFLEHLIALIEVINIDAYKSNVVRKHVTFININDEAVLVFQACADRNPFIYIIMMTDLKAKRLKQLNGIIILLCNDSRIDPCDCHFVSSLICWQRSNAKPEGDFIMHDLLVLVSTV